MSTKNPPQSLQQKQRKILHLMLKFPNRLRAYSQDSNTIDCLCGLHNLGIVNLHDNRVTIRSTKKAKRFLAQ